MVLESPPKGQGPDNPVNLPPTPPALESGPAAPPQIVESGLSFTSDDFKWSPEQRTRLTNFFVPEDIDKPETLAMILDSFIKYQAGTPTGTDLKIVGALGQDFFPNAYEASTGQNPNPPAEDLAVDEEEEPEWSTILGNISAASQPSLQDTSRVTRRPSELRRVARMALERSTTIGRRAYERTSGFLDALDRRVKSLSFEENGVTSESVRGDPINIEAANLADSSYTQEIYNQLKANRDAVTGVEEVPGYLDYMVRETHDEVTTFDKKRQELEASRERNQGAITVLHKGSEIAGQSELVTFDIAVGQATDVEKNAWLTAKNAEITAGNTQIGKLKRKTPLLTEIPAEATTLRVTRSQAKKRSEDEYAFDPTQAEPVMNARKKLDNAIEHEREAYKEYVDFINKSIATTEQQSFEALFDIMSELRVSCSDNPDVVNKILSDPGVATSDVKQRVVDLAKKIKSGLTFADKKQGVNLDTPEGVFDYLKKRMADSRLQTYETERISVSASVSVREIAEAEYKISLQDAERWRVGSDGSPIGKGHKELAQVNTRENALIATLGDTAIVDLYLRDGYLPDGFEPGAKKGGEFAIVATEQTNIATLNSQIVELENNIESWLIDKAQSKNSAVDYVTPITRAKKEIRLHETELEASILSIQEIMDPSIRLQKAAERIRGLGTGKLRTELQGLGLTIGSEAELQGQLDRVGQAFTQALEGIKAKGEVPTELKLFGEVIAILRGEQPPEIVAGPPVQEPPSQPAARPGTPSAPGAAPRLEPETNPAGGTAEQLADIQASTALDVLDPSNPADRLIIIAGARDLVGELSKPGSEGTLQLAWEISNLPDEQRGKTLAEVRSRVEKHPALKPLVRLFDLLDQLKMNYRDLVSLGKVKQKSLEGPAAAAVGLMLLLQSLSKIDAEAAGATNQQTEH